MSAAPWELISVDNYLSGERNSTAKREYFGGLVYTKPEECARHNQIAGNAFATTDLLLQGNHWWAFDSGAKIRIRMPTQTRFYYPDVSVVCRPNPPEDSFQDELAFIVEVLSRSTRRIDENEKKDAYLNIPSLNVYMLIEQDRPLVTLHRRTEAGFVRETYAGLDAVIPLGEIGIVLPLADIYRGVTFVPEPDAPDDA